MQQINNLALVQYFNFDVSDVPGYTFTVAIDEEETNIDF